MKEFDIRDMIYNAIVAGNFDFLVDRGFVQLGHTDKIKVFKEYRIGDYGICDLVVICQDGNYVSIYIFEIKNNSPKLEDYNQLARYARGMRHFLIENTIKRWSLYPYLITRDFKSNNDVSYMTELFFDHLIFEYKINGIFFKPVNHNWTLTEPNFNDDSRVGFDAFKKSEE